MTESWKDKLHDEHGVPVCGPIAVNDGWRPLVEYAYSFIAKDECLRVAQVKEKFGGARIYVDHDYANCDGEKCSALKDWYVVEPVIERLSYMMCEICGKRGYIRSGSWVQTLCDDHADGRPATNWE